MNRRSFLSRITLASPTLFLPRAMDSYVWKAARGISAEDVRKIYTILGADFAYPQGSYTVWLSQEAYDQFTAPSLPLHDSIQSALRNPPSEQPLLLAPALAQETHNT